MIRHDYLSQSSRNITPTIIGGSVFWLLKNVLIVENLVLLAMF